MLNPSVFDKINVGCGYDHRQGYLNVDMDAACKPDVLLANNDFAALPKGHFAHLLARDVLEHIPRAQTMSALLEWADLLRVGGKMSLHTSSILGVARLIEATTKFAGHYNCEIYLYGNQTHSGDFHYTGFTEQTLRTYVTSAGFGIESLAVEDAWLFAVEATRVEEWSAPLRTHNDAPAEAFLAAAYDAALGRAPLEPYRSGHLRDLASGQTRRDLLKALFGSLERNLRVAERLGL